MRALVECSKIVAGASYTAQKCNECGNSTQIISLSDSESRPSSEAGPWQRQIRSSNFLFFFFSEKKNCNKKDNR
jgi:hypothetical protein